MELVDECVGLEDTGVVLHVVLEHARLGDVLLADKGLDDHVADTLVLLHRDY